MRQSDHWAVGSKNTVFPFNCCKKWSNKKASLLYFSSDVSSPYLRSRHLLKQPSKNFLIRQLRHSKSSCWWPTLWQAKTPSTFGAETTGHQLICINWNLRTKGFFWGRLHHKCSETQADPHNANRGFFFSHMGWLMVRWGRSYFSVIEHYKSLTLFSAENTLPWWRQGRRSTCRTWRRTPSSCSSTATTWNASSWQDSSSPPSSPTCSGENLLSMLTSLQS